MFWIAKLTAAKINKFSEGDISFANRPVIAPQVKAGVEVGPHLQLLPFQLLYFVVRQRG